MRRVAAGFVCNWLVGLENGMCSYYVYNYYSPFFNMEESGYYFFSSSGDVVHKYYSKRKLLFF